MLEQTDGSNKLGTMSIFPKSGSVFLKSQDLEVSLNEMARYAGGSRYQMDSKMETLARSFLNQAISLCRPAFGYTAHKVLDAVPDKGFLMENNILIPSPPDISSDTASVVSVICTIGPNIEEKIRFLNVKGMYLEMVYLDASGVALLEAVVQRAYERISELALKACLYVGCRWAPGYETTPMKYQRVLFDIVDADDIGVQLMQGGVMRPFKSLSFWIPLTRHPVAPVNRNNCRRCSLKGCKYRITPSMEKEV